MLSDTRPNRLIVHGCAAVVDRSVEGSDGLAPEPPAGRLAWLEIDVPACRAFAVAWLERGTAADQPGIRHARHGIPAGAREERGQLMAAAMIGVDPHKGSHTAVAIGTAEEVLGQVRVRACAAQAGQLPAWPERTWAVEGAGTFWEERRGQFIDPFSHRQG